MQEGEGMKGVKCAVYSEYQPPVTLVTHHQPPIVVCSKQPMYIPLSVCKIRDQRCIPLEVVHSR